MAQDHGTLYHLVPVDTWNKCKADAQPYYPSTYEQDGFIHLTKEANLLLTVANHFYKDVPGNWCVLCIDSSQLTSKVVFEPAAPVGTKASAGLTDGSDEPLFPHLYGTIDFSSVTEELAVQRGEGGEYLSIQGL